MLHKINDAVEFIRSKSTLQPRIGITLGSGLSSFAESVDVECSIPYSDIPHFFPPSVAGHPGQLILGNIGSNPVAILQGRIHFYEGHSLQEVVFPTRVLGKLGVDVLVLTNAAGGLNAKMQPGHFMIIEDHLNLTGNNPLIGPNMEELGVRFPDMSEPYDRKLISLLEKVMIQHKVPFSKGVYCGVTGPTYETAAEIKYMAQLGGGAVGMSTVPETIAAKHMGLKVCGISCVTNLGTGLSPNPISHDEVKEIGKRVEKEFSLFLKDFVEQI
ncbi:MAG: purine-nucleoside phosphorylase [Bdellovibrionales bacterium]|nr:purine-nucleoside phosphorylase [Bdellovibrionales bacterium]